MIIKEYQSKNLRRFPLIPADKKEEKVLDLRYMMDNMLDYGDIVSILRSEKYLSPVGKVEPTEQAYSIVWMDGGWWVPGLSALLIKYEVPAIVKKLAWNLINSILCYEFKVSGWLPPDLIGTLAEEQPCEELFADEKEALQESVQRCQMALLSEVAQWSHKTKTSTAENNERIDSYCRWVVKVNYNCYSSLTVLLRCDQRKKRSRDERGLTAKQQNTKKPKVSTEATYVDKCEKLPLNVTKLVQVFSSVKLQDYDLDLIGYNNMYPILRWVGGKRKWAYLIQSLLQSLEVYPDKIIEPFCGGAAISLLLGFKEATINDRNPGLINFYRYIRSGKSIKTDYIATRSKYIIYRTRYNKLLRIITGILQTRQSVPAELESEWASLFMYLASFSFNGLWRVNPKGFMNTPSNMQKSLIEVPLEIKYKEAYPQFAKIAKDWSITNVDFTRVPIGGRNALLYVDPPYDEQFSQYTSDFNQSRQEEVFQWMVQHDGPIICHNAQTPLIMCLAAKYGFSIFTYSGKSSVAAKSKSRGKVPEVIMFKNFKLRGN
jgi:DNA adenine methylase